MSDVTVAPAAGEAVSAPDTSSDLNNVWKHTPSGDGPLSPRDAARSLVDARRKRDAEKSQDTAPAAPEAAAEPKESEAAQAADDAAPPTEATGETQATDPVETPPLELPRSWTKDRAEHWAKLDRGIQELLLEHDRTASAEVRRVQNEAAEQRKAAEAERQKAEQLAKQYESAIPQLLQTLQQQQMGEFSDIQSMADVEKLSREDPFRFAQWQASTMKVAALQQEAQAAQKRQEQEYAANWQKFAAKEDAAFLEKVPEFADAGKREKISKAAVNRLKDLGFSDQEMNDAYSGKLGISLRDHRLQLLILDSINHHEAKTKVKEVVKNKAVPPVSVQKPGVARAPSAGNEERIQNLSKQLENASGQKALRIAAELRMARRAAR